MPNCTDCQHIRAESQAEVSCSVGRWIVYPEMYDVLSPNQEAFKGNGCKTFLPIYLGPRPTRFERILCEDEDA